MKLRHLQHLLHLVFLKIPNFLIYLRTLFLINLSVTFIHCQCRTRSQILFGLVELELTPLLRPDLQEFALAVQLKLFM